MPLSIAGSPAPSNSGSKQVAHKQQHLHRDFEVVYRSFTVNAIDTINAEGTVLFLCWDYNAVWESVGFPLYMSQEKVEVYLKIVHLLKQLSHVGIPTLELQVEFVCMNSDSSSALSDF